MNSFSVLSYRVRRPTSEYWRSAAQAGVVPAPAPGPVEGTLLRTKAEARHPATAPLNVIWPVSALPREDRHLSTTAHLHATIGKRPNEFEPA